MLVVAALGMKHYGKTMQNKYPMHGAFGASEANLLFFPFCTTCRIVAAPESKSSCLVQLNCDGDYNFFFLDEQGAVNDVSWCSRAQESHLCRVVSLQILIEWFSKTHEWDLEANFRLSNRKDEAAWVIASLVPRGESWD